MVIVFEYQIRRTIHFYYWHFFISTIFEALNFLRYVGALHNFAKRYENKLKFYQPEIQI